MQWLAAGVLAQILACAVVGTRLLLLARRTRKLPEAAFGGGFLLLGMVGHPVSIAARTPLVSSPEVAGGFLALGFLAQNLGCACIYLGTWKVFRPRRNWALAIVLVAALAFVSSLVGQALTVGFHGGNDTGIWYWVGFLARAATFFWAAFESLRYYGLMRRRLALGLADPVVTDRFRLWGVTCASLSLAMANFGITKLLGVNAATAPSVLVTSSLIGLVSGAAMWLAFFPPARYTRRLAAARATSTDDIG